MATKGLKSLETVIVSLKKQQDYLIKLKSNFSISLEQKRYLKNKAKIVSLTEYKKIIKEIENTISFIASTEKEIDELVILKLHYEKNSNKKS